MNIIPNNNPKKKEKTNIKNCPKKPACGGVPPYFQNYYPFANYLDGPENDCFTPQNKKGKIPTALKAIAGAVVAFTGFKVVSKNMPGIKNFFSKLLGR